MIFSKNVLTVMTGTVFGQLIPILASPLLTRLYSGEQFGLLALYVSISSLFVLIACGRYEVAIVLPAENKKALDLVGLSLLITGGTAVVSFFIMSAGGNLFARWFNAAALPVYLLMVPLSVISMGIYQTVYNWALRAKNFKTLSRSRIFQSVITVAISLLMGISSFQLNGLIVGLIAGQLAAAVFICLTILPRQPISWSSIDKSGVKQAALHYKDFPRVSTVHVLLDSFQNYGINFLLSFYFGNVVLGWYFQSYRVLRAPLALVGAAYAQVLYPELSELKNQGVNLRPAVVQAMKKILLIGLPFFVLLLFAAPWIFKIAFGPQWEEAGVLAQIMTPWLYLNLACSPISGIPNILNRQKKSFLINLTGIAGSFLVFLAAINFYHTIHIPFLFLSLVSAAYLFFFTWWIIRISATHLHGSEIIS